MRANMPGAMSAKACNAVSAGTLPAALSPNACAVSAASMLAASMLAPTMSASMLAPAMSPSMLAPAMSTATMPAAATMSAATPAGVCFECEKRHYEEQRSSQASAGRHYRPHGPAGLGARRRRHSLGKVPKSF
jgi:hypothetical protein